MSDLAIGSGASPIIDINETLVLDSFDGSEPICASSIQNHSTTRPTKAPWKKLLYLKQPYPDNYTDVSFLSQLKRNTTVAKYSYFQLVDDFILIVFYISCILLVDLMFIGIYAKGWDPVIPTAFSTTMCVFIYGLLRYHYSLSSISRSNLNLKSFVLISFMILIVSPILKSLTKSTSSDSIWAISSILCIVNSVFYEYSSTKVYKPTISTNISVSNAIVLASRLNSTSQVFVFMLFAVQANILLPLYDATLRQNRKLKYLHYVSAFSTFILVDYWIYKLVNYKFLLYWLLSVFVAMFLMPAYFLSLQRYKNELQGPWDIAKPKLNREAY
ncbi:Gpi2 protein [Candida orthopsilosis Co 90-125]|uniref:Gpi2 protein n=1 Tax=Candida orthopsilosis (strain 90-125) TaxID=1136231 RepID=H8X5J8_CANO9|nr:Gpi2 protein [Candida orthopsilosis Co 90-125]CCG23455.1 Gpi2 protein [Candida orthopsilosis Co 90-125]